MQIEDIMKPASGKKPKITINKEESIDNAAIILKDKKISELAVVDDEGKIIGIVTDADIIENSDDINEDFFLD